MKHSGQILQTLGIHVNSKLNLFNQNDSWNINSTAFRLLLMLVFLIAVPVSLYSQHQNKQGDGIQYFNEGQYDKSKTFFLSVLKNDPQNSEAMFYLGRVFFAEKNFDEAVLWLDKAADLTDTNAYYYYWLGNAYNAKLEQAGIFDLPSIYSKTKSSYEKAIEIDPRNIEARYELAKAYFNGSFVLGGSKEKAKQHLDELSKISPAKGYELSAYFFMYDEEWEQAQNEYLKYLELNSENDDVQTNLGICYFKLSNLGKAFECSKKAVDINSKNDIAHYLMGRIYEEKGENQLAKVEYETAIRLKPDNEKYKYYLKNLQ